MPKIRTHKTTAKRFKLSAGGKLLRTKIGKSHLRRRKPKKVRRVYQRTLVLSAPAEVRRVKRLAPYLTHH
jgi:large subunit ribosomal protein L35